MANWTCRESIKADIKAHRLRVLLQAAEAKTSLKKAKASLSKGTSPMDALLDRAGAPITSRSGMEERVKELYTELFRSTTPVPRCPLPYSYDTPLPILSEKERERYQNEAEFHCFNMPEHFILTCI
ncbi:hypothetical protein PRIPAC_70593 [Pristionchus pacificus]|uniref:Uncharacterized protein n=1 Tax=Pristionchus pacificus TaxID=54126 RepID=A0A2A6BRI7_PRIPA|nr:hypothetical protein PRIPAC_70593 [Pristionchus pacificus]|eukprot:PDM68436.1 hypothetical protein PRIPAC_43938 [Pristionchus pacificus]